MAYLMVYREALPTLFTDDYRFELGRAITLSDGQALALISTGPRVAESLRRRSCWQNEASTPA